MEKISVIKNKDIKEIVMKSRTVSEFKLNMDIAGMNYPKCNKFHFVKYMARLIRFGVLEVNDQLEKSFKAWIRENIDEIANRNTVQQWIYNIITNKNDGYISVRNSRSFIIKCWIDKYGFKLN